MLRIFASFLLLQVSVSLMGQGYSLESVLSYPFPSELTASADDSRVAWASNVRGLRNVYVAQGPDFTPRQITPYEEDDGQEITSLQFTPDSQWLVYVRGGEHGSNWDSQVGVNPAHAAKIPKVTIWKARFDGSETVVLAEGDDPTVSPDGAVVAFIRNRQVWTVSLEGGSPSQLFEIKGSVGSLQWAPDGKKLLFVTQRSTHALIGHFDFASERVTYVAPSFSRDMMPRWSKDGKKIAFVRRPGGTGEPKPILAQYPTPWEIWIATANGEKAYCAWKSPATLRGSYPTTHGGANLHWTAAGELVFLSYEDGWPHLYKLSADGKGKTQLTQGKYMVEHIKLDNTGSKAVFSANFGSDPEDIDRRHVGMLDLEKNRLQWLTEGSGIETYPVLLSRGDQVAFLSSDAKQPLLPAVKSVDGGRTNVFGRALLPVDFPENGMVVPKQVTFKAPDGALVHGQLFEKAGGTTKKPAVVFVHGGPQRQMLLGWHYGDYYSNTYAINQYLAEQGLVVLSVNFRLGIGYGYEFHKPPHAYLKGASEYQDIKAAGEFLAALPQVDAGRIGIYGGSYGGYLTALALARDSGLFKVGVDIHGVHELSSRLEMPEGYEQSPDFELALKTAWESSPLADLDSWESPVLFIHGDDDRNVQVSHTTDIIRRFEDKGKAFDYLMIPDDSHHWMKFSNQLKVGEATVSYLIQHLK